MGEVQTRLESLERLGEERAFLLKVLGLWEHAKEAGYTSEEIRAFTFRPEWLTKEQKRENQRRASRRSAPAYCDKNWHNALRLKSGDLVKIPGIARPIPPEWYNSEARARLV